MATDEAPLGDDVERWRDAHSKKLSGVKERASLTGRPLGVLYAPQDGDGEVEAYRRDIGLPRELPDTCGGYPAMYQDRLRQMRRYSGFGDAESTNERWTFLLPPGNNGVSAAFDLPTQVELYCASPGSRFDTGRNATNVTRSRMPYLSRPVTPTVPRW
jgi:methylmalonyl-CoA mutase N-terminal domain/subunit